MPWPSIAPPPANRANLTPSPDNHPADHNTLATVLTDIVAVLGAGPNGSYTDVTQRLASDPLLQEMGVFADTATRDAQAGSRRLAYITGTNELQVHRGAEWVTISQKITVSSTPPAGPSVGDLWARPVT